MPCLVYYGDALSPCSKELGSYSLQIYMLCAIDQSEPLIDQAALSILLAQPSIDHAKPSVDGFGAGRTDLHGPTDA